MSPADFVKMYGIDILLSITFFFATIVIRFMIYAKKQQNIIIFYNNGMERSDKITRPSNHKLMGSFEPQSAAFLFRKYIHALV